MGIPFPLKSLFMGKNKMAVATVMVPSCMNSTKGISLIFLLSHKPISSIILMAM
jgi:hypothetical protein